MVMLISAIGVNQAFESKSAKTAIGFNKAFQLKSTKKAASSPVNDLSEQFLAEKATLEPDRYPFVSVDQSGEDPDFSEFLHQLRQAVENRDADFIVRHFDPDVQLSFGPYPPTLASLIEDPDESFWLALEKAIAIGCAHYGHLWICPHYFPNLLTLEEINSFDQVIIVGEDIQVRSAPNSNSSALGVLSNEIVAFDREGYFQLSTQDQSMVDTLYGWTPILLNNNQRGFVPSRYAYQPLGYRIGIERVDNQYIVRTFIAGD